jgi:hypothetical protein
LRLLIQQGQAYLDVGDESPQNSSHFPIRGSQFRRERK